VNRITERAPPRRSSGLLADASGVRHGFFGREGGISNGPFASLNCGQGSGDDPDKVRENRARAATALGASPDRLVSAFQVHGSGVHRVEAPWSPDDRPRVDGLVTDRPGLALGILTADCAPVLFADPEAGVIGAAHAGWRGAIGGVTDEVVRQMERLGATRQTISAAIGPTISGRNYEVGPEFHDEFIAADAANARFFMPSEKDGHFMFDLPAYLEQRLGAAGLGKVERTGHCTYDDDRRFYSYRRATHRGEKTYGGMIAAITLGPSEFLKEE